MEKYESHHLGADCGQLKGSPSQQSSLDHVKLKLHFVSWFIKEGENWSPHVLEGYFEDAYKHQKKLINFLKGTHEIM